MYASPRTSTTWCLSASLQNINQEVLSQMCGECDESFQSVHLHYIPNHLSHINLESCPLADDLEVLAWGGCKEEWKIKNHYIIHPSRRMTMWEQGLGSIQVDLGGIVTLSSAIWNSVYISGCLTKKTISCWYIYCWSIIPGTYFSFLRRSSSRKERKISFWRRKEATF